MVRQTEADGIVLDYSMPQTDTPAIIEEVLRLVPKVKTAPTYRSRLMEKLNLSTTAEIIRFAQENEIVG